MKRALSVIYLLATQFTHEDIFACVKHCFTYPTSG